MLLDKMEGGIEINRAISPVRQHMTLEAKPKAIYSHVLPSIGRSNGAEKTWGSILMW